MTHADIYTKFMIEYDKANITSSYPSLTKYEVATILDKAYLALIARKITGNNPRLSTFESDIKSIEDLRPLIVTKELDSVTSETICASNEYVRRLKDDMLYYIEGLVTYESHPNSITSKIHNNEIVSLVSHELARPFKATNSNLPWIKSPVSFIEGDDVHILIDSYKHRTGISKFVATYLKKPALFAKSVQSNNGDSGSGTGSDTEPEVLYGIEFIDTNGDIDNANNSKTFRVMVTRNGEEIDYGSVTFEIVSGENFIDIVGTTYRSCTVETKRHGYYRITATYEYGNNVFDTLRGEARYNRTDISDGIRGLDYFILDVDKLS